MEYMNRAVQEKFDMQHNSSMSSKSSTSSVASYKSDLEVDVDSEVVQQNNQEIRSYSYKADLEADVDSELVQHNKQETQSCSYKSDLEADVDSEVVQHNKQEIQSCSYKSDLEAGADSEVVQQNKQETQSCSYKSDLDGDIDSEVVQHNKQETQSCSYKSDMEVDVDSELVQHNKQKTQSFSYKSDLDDDIDSEVVHQNKQETQLCSYKSDLEADVDSELVQQNKQETQSCSYKSDLDGDIDSEVIQQNKQETQSCSYKSDIEVDIDSEVVQQNKQETQSCSYKSDLDGDIDSEVAQQNRQETQSYSYKSDLDGDLDLEVFQHNKLKQQSTLQQTFSRTVQEHTAPIRPSANVSDSSNESDSSLSFNGRRGRILKRSVSLNQAALASPVHIRRASELALSRNQQILERHLEELTMSKQNTSTLAKSRNNTNDLIDKAEQHEFQSRVNGTTVPKTEYIPEASYKSDPEGDIDLEVYPYNQQEQPSALQQRFPRTVQEDMTTSRRFSNVSSTSNETESSLSFIDRKGRQVPELSNQHEFPADYKDQKPSTRRILKRSVSLNQAVVAHPMKTRCASELALSRNQQILKRKFEELAMSKGNTSPLVMSHNTTSNLTDKPQQQEFQSGMNITVPKTEYINLVVQDKLDMQHQSSKSFTSRTSSSKSGVKGGVDLEVFQHNHYEQQQSALQQRFPRTVQEQMTTSRRSSNVSSTSNGTKSSLSLNDQMGYQVTASFDQQIFTAVCNDDKPSTRCVLKRSFSLNPAAVSLSRKTERALSQNQKVLNEIDELPTWKGNTSPLAKAYDNTRDLNVLQTQQSVKNPTPTDAKEIPTLEKAGSRRNSITGSEKDENLWGKRKIAVHNFLDFSLMIANIAQLRAVLTAEGNQHKNFILVCIIISMIFQIMFAVCMIRRQTLNQQINKAFNSVQVNEEKCERIRKVRKYKRLLDEIGNYLVVFILVANGLITGFGFM